MRYALLAFALVCLTGSRVQGAELDDWCSQVKKPSSIVICSDTGLRQLAAARNQAFTEAKSRLSTEAYQQLLDDQKRWISSYSQACGVPENKPVSSPISSDIVECFRRAGQARVQYIRNYGGAVAGTPTALVPPAPTVEEQALAAGGAAETECFNRLTASAPIQPGYRETYMRSIQSKCIEEANAAAQRVRSAAAERERAERARLEAEKQAEAERTERQRRQEAADAERAREILRKQATAEREAQLAAKLKELGYTLVSPVDLELDWRDLRAASGKIAMKGIYREVEDIEALSVPNKDAPIIRMYSDDASRDARKALLECRNSDFAISKCRMIVGATVATCIRNKGQLNEKEVPCLRVREVFLLPDET